MSSKKITQVLASWASASSLLLPVALPTLAFSETHYTVDGVLFTDASSDQLLKQARAMDSLGDSRLRADVPGGIRLSMGTQIHPTCLRPNVTAFDRVALTRRAESFVQGAIVSVMACGERYPELTTPYIRQWVSQARRMVVVCTSLNVDQTDYKSGHWAGMASPSLSELKDSLTPAERELVGSLKVDPDAHQPVFTFARNTFQDAMSVTAESNYHFPANVFVHETFHATALNNRRDHSQIEQIHFDDNGACGQDLRMDRVKTIAALCTGDTWRISSNDRAAVAETLSERIARCGAKRGCEDLFTSAGNTIHNLYQETFVPHASQDLSSEKAQRLCQRIDEDGFCLRQRNYRAFPGTRGQTTPFSEYEPKLKAFTDRLRTKIGPLIPRSPNQIPASLMQLNPEASQQLLALRNSSPCVSSLFISASDGSLILTPLAASFGTEKPQYWSQVYSNGPPEKSGPDVPMPLTDHLRALQSLLRTQILSQSARGTRPLPLTCANRSEDITRAIQWISDLADSTQKNLESQAMFRAARLRADGHDEGWNGAASLSALEPAIRDQLEKLLGADLLKEYAEALRLYHPESKYFECSRSSLFRGSESVIQGLERLNSRPALRSCPQ